MKTLSAIDSVKNQRKARKASKSYSSRRFYSRLDMAIVKHDEAIKNAKIKRGELVLEGNNEYVYHCSCGATGCLVHASFKTVDREFYR